MMMKEWITYQGGVEEEREGYRRTYLHTIPHPFLPSTKRDYAIVNLALDWQVKWRQEHPQSVVHWGLRSLQICPAEDTVIGMKIWTARVDYIMHEECL